MICNNLYKCTLNQNACPDSRKLLESNSFKLLLEEEKNKDAQCMYDMKKQRNYIKTKVEPTKPK